MAYGILPDNILFIHGKAVDENSELVLGHGWIRTEEDKFDQPPTKNYDGSGDYEYDADDVRVMGGAKMLDQFFEDNFKNTMSVLKNNQGFFSNLKNTTEIFVLGHSLADVDRLYFEEIAMHVCKDATWVLTYYSDDEMAHHKKFAEELGISERNICLTKLMALSI